MIYTIFEILCCLGAISVVPFILSLFVKKLKPYRKKLLMVTLICAVAMVVYTAVFTKQIQAVQNTQQVSNAGSNEAVPTVDSETEESIAETSSVEIQQKETVLESTVKETVDDIKEVETQSKEKAVTTSAVETVEEETLPEFSDNIMPEDSSDLIDGNSIVEYDGVKYLDAEGYLDAGVQVYWLEDGKMEHAGEIKDVAYNTTIDGTEYTYAVKVLFDGEGEAYWKDGERFLLAQKSITGKPMYYVAFDDPKRKNEKEEIDYGGSIEWKHLSISNANPGTDVYVGTGSSKSYLFTIVSINTNNDEMVVKYASGAKESKTYGKMLNNDTLFVKE